MQKTLEKLAKLVIDEMKCQKSTFVLVNVEEINNDKGVRYQVWGKYPDIEIAHVVSAKPGKGVSLEMMAGQVVWAIQEWMDDSRDTPKTKERMRQWVARGKPVEFPVSKDILRLMSA